MRFINSLHSEWIKIKRSAASWLTILGGLLVPIIITFVRLINPEKTLRANSSDHIWNALYNQCWQFMAILLLPMGIILAAGLITQIEYRNNAWKQLLTTPQSLSTIFFAKLSVVVILLIQFFILLNIGIYVSGVLPAIVYHDIPFPQQEFPLKSFIAGNIKFFVCCLPILALQYLLSFHIKNFMIPIGIGIGLIVASMIGVSWKYGYIIPYSYCSLYYLINERQIDPTANIYLWSLGYFSLFTILNYLLFLNKALDKGSLNFKLSRKTEFKSLFKFYFKCLLCAFLCHPALCFRWLSELTVVAPL